MWAFIKRLPLKRYGHLLCQVLYVQFLFLKKTSKNVWAYTKSLLNLQEITQLFCWSTNLSVNANNETTSSIFASLLEWELVWLCCSGGTSVIIVQKHRSNTLFSVWVKLGMFDLFLVFPLLLLCRSGQLALLAVKVTASKLSDNQQHLNEQLWSGASWGL